MLLTGESIDAATALDWGLVNRIVPADELDAAVAALAARSHARARSRSRSGRRRSTRRSSWTSAGAYDLAKSVMSMNSLARDAQEGIGAFLEKRAPRWTGS